MANQSSTPFDQGLFLVHLNRGREHFDARNFADAAEEFEEARRLRPADDSVLNLLGLAYFKQEKYKEADSVYRKLIELNPESSTLYFNLGLVCFKIGDLDRAEATFLRALELKPDNQKTHFYLGNIYEKKQQYYNAIFQYRKAGANIMVKRVQEKIDRDRPLEREEGEDFSAPTPRPEDAKPRMSALTEAETTSPDLELDKVNVDSLDRRRVLSAIQQSLYPPQPALARPPAPPDDETPLEQLVERAVSTSDTQETLLTGEERSAIHDEAQRLARVGTRDPMDTLPTDTGTSEETMPPPRPRPRLVIARTPEPPVYGSRIPLSRTSRSRRWRGAGCRRTRAPTCSSPPRLEAGASHEPPRSRRRNRWARSRATATGPPAAVKASFRS